MGGTAHDTTARDSAATASDGIEESGFLWVVACPDPSRVGARVQVSRHEALLIGRQVERGGLCLEDPKLSRAHARVAWDGRARVFRVADLSSANGTFLEGARVSVAALSHGSVLRVGESVLVFGVRDLLRELEERLALAAQTEASVVLWGETGTGKELAAKRLHDLSGRRGAFVAVNCAAFSRELMAAELFGHARGAFSGAVAERAGLFRAAEGGTLFLDEVGELPLELQPALLRALQERKVRPLGTEREVAVDVRVVCATHRDLRAAASSGAFRLDLHARLAQIELTVPPLRERAHTLPALIESLALAQGMRVEVAASAMEVLSRARFTQNVRELATLMLRLKAFGRAPHVLDLATLEREAPALLASARSAASEATPSQAPLREGTSRVALEQALARREGKVAEVARDYGVSRMQVYRWLKQWGMQPPERRPARPRDSE